MFPVFLLAQACRTISRRRGPSGCAPPLVSFDTPVEALTTARVRLHRRDGFERQVVGPASLAPTAPWRLESAAGGLVCFNLAALLPLTALLSHALVAHDRDARRSSGDTVKRGRKQLNDVCSWPPLTFF